MSKKTNSIIYIIIFLFTKYIYIACKIINTFLILFLIFLILNIIIKIKFYKIIFFILNKYYL